MSTGIDWFAIHTKAAQQYENDARWFEANGAPETALHFWALAAKRKAMLEILVMHEQAAQRQAERQKIHPARVQPQ